MRLVAKWAACAALVSLPVWGTNTKTWSQNGQAAFEKANLSHLALRSDGLITLAPGVREVYDAATPYLWCSAEGANGSVYLGGGGPGGDRARVYIIDAQGKGRLLAELDGLSVHAIAADRAGQVFAATSPDGKVYRITAQGQSEVFYDPKAKYIWALAFDRGGHLLVATGDKGEVHRVDPAGKGSVWARLEDTNVRALGVDSNGAVIAGTEPNGLVVRIGADGRPFVLHQTGKREVTALAVSGDGRVFVAATGNRLAPAQVGVQTVQQVPIQPPAPQAQPGMAQRIPVATPPALPLPQPVQGGSEVIEIAADGSPRRLWTNAVEVAYSLTIDSSGKPWVGTGNKGNVYRLDSDLQATHLVSLPATQVTALAAGRGGRVMAVTANAGRLFEIGPGAESSGRVESEIFDAAQFARWGRLEFAASANGGTLAFESRSGNLERPQTSWSPWTPLKDGRVVSPAARFLQWRAVLKPAADGRSPELRSVDVAYLPKNLAPRVEEVEVTPFNYRFPAPSTAAAANPSITLPALTRRRPATAPLSLETTASQTVNFAKGHLGARWLAADDNGDKLEFLLEIRLAGAAAWQQLKANLTDRYYSWDSTAFPDGEYRLRVSATDALSNTSDQALGASGESGSFWIDNGAPVISALSGTSQGSRLTVRWRATDAISVLRRAEYSMNGGPWTIVEPTTGLTDSKSHDYQLTLDRPSTLEQTIAVRVYDANENVATDTAVIR
ncbi:MAG: hypothetical protein FJW40_10255 [Acidobacteria bacterium]|nr:hypothetical protein [Acidobacteriota bacterium]